MFFGTVEDRLAFWNDQTETKRLVEIFSVLLPASFIISPLIAKLINDGGYILSFWVLQTLAAVWAGLNFVKLGPVQIFNFVVFSIWRGVLLFKYNDIHH